MSTARSFTELVFWQRARKWSAAIFRETKNKPFARDQRLCVQINDSSESVMSNMAEGFGRGTQEEFITFLGYARTKSWSNQVWEIYERVIGKPRPEMFAAPADGRTPRSEEPPA